MQTQPFLTQQYSSGNKITQLNVLGSEIVGPEFGAIFEAAHLSPSIPAPFPEGHAAQRVDNHSTAIVDSETNAWIKTSKRLDAEVGRRDHANHLKTDEMEMPSILMDHGQPSLALEIDQGTWPKTQADASSRPFLLRSEDGGYSVQLGAFDHNVITAADADSSRQYVQDIPHTSVSKFALAMSGESENLSSSVAIRIEARKPLSVNDLASQKPNLLELPSYGLRIPGDAVDNSSKLGGASSGLASSWNYPEDEFRPQQKAKISPMSPAEGQSVADDAKSTFRSRNSYSEEPSIASVRSETSRSVLAGGDMMPFAKQSNIRSGNSKQAEKQSDTAYERTGNVKTFNSVEGTDSERSRSPLKIDAHSLNALDMNDFKKESEEVRNDLTRQSRSRSPILVGQSLSSGGELDVPSNVEYGRSYSSESLENVKIKQQDIPAHSVLSLYQSFDDAEINGKKVDFIGPLIDSGVSDLSFSRIRANYQNTENKTHLFRDPKVTGTSVDKARDALVPEFAAVPPKTNQIFNSSEIVAHVTRVGGSFDQKVNETTSLAFSGQNPHQQKTQSFPSLEEIYRAIQNSREEGATLIANASGSSHQSWQFDATTSSQPRLLIATVSSSAVLRQITESVQPVRDNLIELTLNPPELGRVRMSLIEQGTSMSITIHSDSLATHDLMRRHQEILRHELLSQGYDSVSFSFEQGQSGFSQEDRQDGSFSAESHGIDDEHLVAKSLPAIAHSGIDIRI
ncbi:flagellar hook-length control protein FliK [Shimia sp.]|uniref:flagellar hook-length control protein FliK n=1 Tax=Shimia sp. TaxID=1954381 RepID=UPI003296CF04